MRKIYALLAIFMPMLAIAQTDNLLPQPQKIEYSNEKFKIAEVQLSTTQLVDDWKNFIAEIGGKIEPTAKNKIEVRIVDSIDGVKFNKDEAYKLLVTTNKIEIEAISERGVYWAIQTLRQLTDNNAINGCRIVDYPAFPIRGFMQDVGRTYISVDELKREIAKLSQYKINVFHWHLTENQAWRLQSKIYPALNDSANVTRMKGKFYTLDEARDLVDFCKKHNVLLIPEIDMPGHSAAFVRTFGCDMQSSEGMTILKKLIDEVCETFDVPYLHIGTDEVQFTNPQFVPEMVAYVRAKGKKVISWNPGWKYAVGEIDIMQLWSARGAAQEGIPAIDSRLHYLNHFDIFGDIVALYRSNVYKSENSGNGILGIILAVWTDRYLSSEYNIVLENGLYPCMLAAAERSWCGGGFGYFDKNGVILGDENSEEFRAFADFERRMLWHKNHNFKNYPFAYVKQTNVHWAVTDAFPNGGDLTKVFPPEKELKNEYEFEGLKYKTQKVTGAGIYLRHTWGNLIPALYKNAQENGTAYAYTYVYSPKAQDVGAWIETQNYSRSKPDLPPPQGKWDYRESRIWVNNTEILPPKWTATHTEESYETLLGNENCVARQPAKIRLNKGWNKVLIKLPIGKFSTPKMTLQKWMFTFIFVKLDGSSQVDGLIYSPDKKM